jgi:hypothetical protein
MTTAGALAITLAVLAPFFVLFVYAHPQNDDWGMAVATMRRGLIDATRSLLRSWGGRYSSHFLNLATPLSSGSFAAWRLALAVYAMAVPLGIWAVVSAMAPHSSSRPERLAVAGVIAALLFAGMPGPAVGLYWMNGAVCYGLAEALALLTIAAMLTAERGNPRWRQAWSGAAALLAAIAAGMNEVTAFLIVGAAGVMLAARVHDRQPSAHVAVVFAAAVAGLVAVLLMPGTHARLAAAGPVGGRHLLPLLFEQSVPVAAGHAARWSTRTPLLPAAVLLGFAAARARRRGAQWSLPQPALAGCTAAAAYVGTVFMPLYGQGGIPAHTLNLVHAVFVGAVMLVAACVGNWFGARRPTESGAAPWIGIAACAAAAALTVVPESPLRTAYADLVTGRAARFDAAMRARYEIIARCGPVCDVSPIEDPPRTLAWFEDAVDEKRDTDFFRGYKDRGYARFFGKRRIRMAPPPPVRL